jgi:formate dehydrogenase major subunit
MGSNMAEQHPVGFQWVIEAKERGAKVIHVDPRFTRTSAMADLHVPIRPGSDIAFLGGIVNYIFEHHAWFEDYVRHYTNGPVIIKRDYQDPEDASGFFSGWDPNASAYSIDTGATTNRRARPPPASPSRPPTSPASRPTAPTE